MKTLASTFEVSDVPRATRPWPEVAYSEAVELFLKGLARGTDHGTQDLVEDDSRILFCSSHQSPLYPGTGAAHETGAHDNVVNVPLPDGAGSDLFRKAMSDKILPRVDQFAPELLLISAGFDAHAHDPLAGMQLREEDFAWITRQLCALADTHCDGRVVSCLEGGYDLEALGASARAHVEVLMERGA